MATPAKLLLFGASGVGKTSIVSQLLRQTFKGDFDLAENEELQKLLNVDGIFHYVDIFGTQDVVAANTNGTLGDLIQTANCFVFVYSITDQASVTYIRTIYNDILGGTSLVKFPLAIIGNKSDLEKERVVSTQEGEDLANLWRGSFYEASALNGTNCEEPFVDVVRQLLERRANPIRGRKAPISHCTLI